MNHCKNDLFLEFLSYIHKALILHIGKIKLNILNTSTINLVNPLVV